MNRKDLVSLMEAYEDIILDKEIESSPEENELDVNVYSDDSDDIENSHQSSDEFSDEPDEETLEDFEEEKNKMVEAHLHTIRSHAHEIYGCLERGALIEPWMQEKLAIANDYIIHVANAIMYKK
jgi:hypothetical protein